ncbi:MAG: UDP-N-acetylmuramoyl-L-alanine--D-glutamate ligase [Bacteroidota bacterium]
MKKRIVILGAGESGTGCAILALKQGYEVFVSDKGSIKDNYIQELNLHNVAFEQNKHTETLILNADEIIKSPGIPDKSDIIVKAKEQNIPIISEIEFGARYTDAKHVCITGTNGKTTTTMLCYHILSKAGFNVGLGGNIGKSYARQVAENNFEYFVLELSSFQLDNTYNFRPNIAILCNITPDHLDRYNYEFQNYIDSKFRIAMNQTEDDFFIYCADDKITVENLSTHKIDAQQIPFAYGKKLDKGAYVIDNEMVVLDNSVSTKTDLSQNYTNTNTTSNNQHNLTNNYLTMFMNDFALKGIHNSYNGMAAAIAANVLNIRKETIRESLMDFQNVEHRLEYVATIGGIEYINDSKATNVNSTWYALESMEKPVVWIVGGVDKGNDYESLLPMVKEKVKVIVCLGLDNTKIHSAFSKHVDLMLNTTSADEAVKVACRFAAKGDVVLLSPACASFDLFANYEDRGHQFKAAVKNL